MCTETKDARVHCTILNDHTNRRHTPPDRESRPTIAPRADKQTPRRGPGRPLRTQQCAAHPLHKERAGRLVIPHFSSNPLPPPTTTVRRPSSGRYWGPPPPEPDVHRTFACEHAR